MKYAFIKEHNATFRVFMLCRALGVSTKAYYAFRRRKPSVRKKEDVHLGDFIEVKFHENRRCYGVKRIRDALQDEGKYQGKARVSRLMKERGLEAKGKKKFRVTTDSGHHYLIAANVLERNFTPDAPDRVWAGDITYIHTQEGWMYLAVFLDLFSRKVVGWSLYKRLTSGFVLKAFERALYRRKPAAGLLVHTDRGVQYASSVFRNILKDGSYRLSMSRKGNCWDNAVVEASLDALR